MKKEEKGQKVGWVEIKMNKKADTSHMMYLLFVVIIIIIIIIIGYC